MISLHQLVRMHSAERAKLDIILTNLVCASDLPKAEGMNIPYCLRTVDRMAAEVADKTACRLPFYRKHSHRWGNSEGRFRIHQMVSVLGTHFNVRYNPAKIPLDVPLETPDSFVFGIIQGDGGTCATLPVLYAAVGRRLGYPLKLVSAMGKEWGHVFARWDDPAGERFNIEINNEGFGGPRDEHYLDGRFVPGGTIDNRDWLRSGTILKSLTPDEEVALFLSQRMPYCATFAKSLSAVESIAWAVCLAPENLIYRDLFRLNLQGWTEKLKKRVPPNFPPITMRYTLPRRFPETLALKDEQTFLTLASVEIMLNDPEFESHWWKPLRDGQPMPRALTEMVVACGPKGYHIEPKRSLSPRY